MPDDIMSTLSTKELLVFVPAIGSAIAITYDVGYFAALDINLFTVFSISEHIAFALEVIPLAILASTLLIICPIAFDWGLKIIEQEANFEMRTGKKIKFYEKKTFWLQVVGTIWTIAYVYFDRSRSSIAIAVLFIAAMILIAWLPSTLFSRPVILIGASTIVGLTLAFTIGMDVATSYRNSTIYRYTVKTADTELKAKVVRSGERGLLFHDEASKQLLLLPWSEIKSVSSSK
jgi:hypothetical protein